jgi:hypothetical protein
VKLWGNKALSIICQWREALAKEAPWKGKDASKNSSTLTTSLLLQATK